MDAFQAIAVHDNGLSTSHDMVFAYLFACLMVPPFIWIMTLDAQSRRTRIVGAVAMSLVLVLIALVTTGGAVWFCIVGARNVAEHLACALGAIAAAVM